MTPPMHIMPVSRRHCCRRESAARTAPPPTLSAIFRAAAGRRWRKPWLEFGCDLEEASSLDWYKAEGGDDYLCRTGFGALVARLAEGLTIHLDTEVREIDWTGPQVRLATSRGTVTCATCVVTVPVAVLNAGRPAFRPALPDWKRDALQAMISAQYLTIGLRFSADTVMPVARDSGASRGRWLARAA